MTGMKDFIVTEYNLISEKIAKPACIVMLADLHNQQYGTGGGRLLAAIKKQKPDFILLAGDMLVCRSEEREQNLQTAEFIVKLSEIAPVFYGMGNHERGVMDEIRHTNGVWQLYQRVWENCPDVHMLQDEKFCLPEYNICICGLNLGREYYTRIYKKKLYPDVLYEKLGENDAAAYTILLAHNPDYFRAYTAWKPDLIVSGHNHGGMIRLGRLGGLVSPRMHPFPKYDYGLYEDAKNQVKMVVTSGCGYHSIPLRINNPPELCVLHIQNPHRLLK